MVKNACIKPRPPRSIETLRAVSNDLYHAVHMLHYCARTLKEGVFHEPELNDALSESYYIHARELLEFFYPSKRARNREDTVLWVDFRDGTSSWAPMERSSFLESIQDWLHKGVAHLTYDRQYNTFPSHFEYARVYNEILELVESFVGEVGHDKLTERLRGDFRLFTNEDLGLTTATHGSVAQTFRRKFNVVKTSNEF